MIKIHTHTILLKRIIRYLPIVLIPFFALGQDSIVSNKSVSYHHKRATLYMHKDDLANATQELNTASKIAEANEDLKGLLDTYNRFALLHLELEDKPTALFYRDRAGIFLKGIEYPSGEALNKYINARLMLEENKPFQALELLDEALKLSNDKNLLNNIQLTRANIYLNLDRFEDAEQQYNALLVNSDDLEQSYLATKANLGLAELNYEQDEIEKSTNYAEAALKISTKHNYQRLISKSNAFLQATYEQLGEYDKALEKLKGLMQLKDSVFTIEKLREQTRTADQITIGQLRNINSKLQSENEELLQSENRAEVTAILSLAFLTIISLLAVSLFRNNQIKLKTNDLLQTKNSELEKARDDAIEAMQAKSNFLSTVTHELRTPLYAVTGLTHILLEENPSDHQKEHLKSLKFSGDYLLNFINDILQINKIDADKLETLSVEFKLKKVLSEVIESLQQRANENDTRVVLEFDNKIPNSLLGDPMKLSQIFMNLVGNALKFTSDGQVTVIAKLLERGEDKAKIHFAVKDNGIGISEEQQKKIFDSFEQGSIQINREYGGTGLGLTIVKSLLGLFNSKINLESKENEGSKFFFDIEFKCEEPAIADIPFELDPEEFDFEGNHILIVEDNKINQVITKKMLTKKEMTADIANNGQEAVDMAKQNRYDCILMDIHMPIMGGVEAMTEIRKFNSTIPIIALTAVSMEDSVEEFLSVGANDVVTKPFKPEVFYHTIGENILKTRMQSQS